MTSTALDGLFVFHQHKSMERTKPLPPGTYWCRKSVRFVCPGDPRYKADVLEEYTLGPLERGCFGDDADTDVRGNCAA